MRFCSGLLVASSLTLIGCSGAVETTSVGGKVMVSGKPLNSGAITFAGPQNYIASGYIQPDGTYEVGNVPLGEVKVTITPAQPVVNAEAGTDPVKILKAPAARPIPAKYAKPDNDLTFTVITGGMTKDFDLKP